RAQAARAARRPGVAGRRRESVTVAARADGEHARAGARDELSHLGEASRGARGVDERLVDDHEDIVRAAPRDERLAATEDAHGAEEKPAAARDETRVIDRPERERAPDGAPHRRVDGEG